MHRSAFALLVLLISATLMMNACSNSEETDPVTPGPTPSALAVDDLVAIGGTGASVTLAWTSPQWADKATIRYDLRYTTFGSENQDWDSWTVERAPESDTAPGQEHRHVVTSLTSGQVYSFGLKASTDGVSWTQISNITVATAALVFDTTPPGPVSNLMVIRGTETSLTMGWPLAGDDGIYGQAESYEARYSTDPINPANWAAATPVPGAITTSSVPGMMQTEITGLTVDQEYYVAVTATDDQGLTSELSDVAIATPTDRTTLYVNVEGTGDYPTIEEAIEAATIGDLVLVGPGRYTWTNQATGDSLHGLIHLPRWWPGTDTYFFEMRSLAGPEATILDAEHEARVMVVTGGSSGEGEDRVFGGITIDGFTFTNGKATATQYSDQESWAGAGLALHLSSTTVRNCIFTGNEATEGGGLWCGGQGYVVIEDCLFENNDAKFGGGIALLNSLPRMTVRNCLIRDNHATFNGGGMIVYHATVTLENLLIVRNDCSDEGGGISFITLNPGCTFSNSTVADNEAPTASGILLSDTAELLIDQALVAFNFGSRPIRLLVNSYMDIGCSLIFGNDISNLLPNNATDLGGNLEVDPMFCDRSDYLLHGDSPCLPGNHPGGMDCGTIGARGVGCGP